MRCERPKLSDLRLTTDDPTVFYRAQWTKAPCPHFVFVAYRVAIAAYILGVYVAAMVGQIEASGGQTFLFLTTLAMTVFVIYLQLAAGIAVIDGVFLWKKNSEDMGIRHKIHWLFFNVTISINIIVTLIYWSALYRPTSASPSFYDFHLHAVPFIVTTVDLLFITAVPVRLLHCVYPLGFGTAYAVMTLIFWGAGGRTGSSTGAIYPFIDYGNNPGLAAGTICGVFVAVIFLHGILWCLYKARVWVWKTWVDSRAGEEQVTLEEIVT